MAYGELNGHELDDVTSISGVTPLRLQNR